jgi:hypothetical protein
MGRPAAANSGGVQLAVMLTAHIPTPYGYVFRAPGNSVSRLRGGLTVGDDALISPCPAFVVRHPSAGVILIDTGLHPHARQDLPPMITVDDDVSKRSLRELKAFADQDPAAILVPSRRSRRLARAPRHRNRQRRKRQGVIASTSARGLAPQLALRSAPRTSFGGRAGSG